MVNANNILFKVYHGDSSGVPTSNNKMNEAKTRSYISSKRCPRMLIQTGAAAVLAMALTMPSGTMAFGNLASFSSRTVDSSTTIRYMTLEQVSDFYQNFPLQSAVLTCGVKASVADTIAQVKPQIDAKHQLKKQQEEEEQMSSISGTIVSSTGASTISPQQLSESSMEGKLKADFSRFVSSNKDDDALSWEATRNLAYVLYGGIFVGLMSHLEYSYVFPFIFGNEKTMAITIEKVFFDNLIAAPLMWLPPAYFIKAWIYGSTGEKDFGPMTMLQEGWEKYVTDVKDNSLLLKYWSIWFPAQSVSFSVVPDHLRVAFMASISFFWFILFSSVSSKGDAAPVAAEPDSQ